jgi:hypothetical protein
MYPLAACRSRVADGTAGAPAGCTPLLHLKGDGVLWQDSARTTLATADSHPVGAHQNYGSAPVYFHQPTAGARPTRQTYNGLPVVRFGGSPRHMLTSAPLDLSGTSAVTILAVAKQTFAASEWIYEHGPDWFAVPTAFVFAFDGSGNVVARLNGNVSYAYAASASSAAGGWHVSSAVYDKTLATNEASVWLDGVAGTHPFQANNTNAFSAQTGYLGSRAGTSLFLLADIGEFLIYDVALTDEQRQAKEAELKAKWATP